MANMLKRLGSLALALILVLSMVPVNTNHVHAAEETTTQTADPNPVAPIADEWTEVNSHAALLEAVAAGGNIKLTGKFEITSQVNLPEKKTVTIDLNGQTITATNRFMINQTGSKLVMMDSVGEGSITFNYQYGFYVESKGTLTIKSGRYIVNSYSANPYPVYAKGTVYINGGYIEANTSGKYLCTGLMLNGATATMTGGQIVANSEDTASSTNVYGVRLYSSTNNVFSMTGGSVTANAEFVADVSSSSCNGVLIEKGKTCELLGGTISVKNTGVGAASAYAIKNNTADVNLTIGSDEKQLTINAEVKATKSKGSIYGLYHAVAKDLEITGKVTFNVTMASTDATNGNPYAIYVKSAKVTLGDEVVVNVTCKSGRDTIGISVSAGEIIADGCEVNGTGKSVYLFYVGANGTATVKDGVFTANATGTNGGFRASSATNAKINVEGGWIKSTKTGESAVLILATDVPKTSFNITGGKFTNIAGTTKYSVAKYLTEDYLQHTDGTVFKDAGNHPYYGKVGGQAATCTEDGIVDHYKCQYCDYQFYLENGTKVEIENLTEWLAGDGVIDKLGHSFSGAGSTCGNGCGMIACSEGHTKGELILAKAYTCDEDGYIAHYICTICGTYMNEQEQEVDYATEVVIPAAHTAIAFVGQQDPTFDETGLEAHWYCSDCQKYYAGTVEQVGEELEAPVVIPRVGVVATIGEERYASLQAAIDAAAEGTEIVMQADHVVTNAVTIAEGKKLTIDLNGKTLTSNGANAIENSGDLTIKGGTVRANDNNGVVNSGTLKIVDGTYVGYMVAIENNEGATLTIDTATAYATHSEDKYVKDSYTYAVLNKGTATINNGTYYVGENRETGVNVQYAMAVRNSAGTLTIKGGNFYANVSSPRYAYTNSSGGTSYRTMYSAGLFNSKGTATINGGTFNGQRTTNNDHQAYSIRTANDSKTTINGGTFLGESGAGNINGTSKVTINGGILSRFYLNSGAQIYVNGGEFRQTGTSTAFGFGTGSDNAVLEIKDGIFKIAEDKMVTGRELSAVLSSEVVATVKTQDDAIIGYCSSVDNIYAVANNIGKAKAFAKIELLQDVEDSVGSDFNVLIDLNMNGHTWMQTVGGNAINIKNVDLSKASICASRIYNGTILAKNGGVVGVACRSGALQIENMTILSTSSIAVGYYVTDAEKNAQFAPYNWIKNSTIVGARYFNVSFHSSNQQDNAYMLIENCDLYNIYNGGKGESVFYANSADTSGIFELGNNVNIYTIAKTNLVHTGLKATATASEGYAIHGRFDAAEYDLSELGQILNYKDGDTIVEVSGKTYTWHDKVNMYKWTTNHTYGDATCTTGPSCSCGAVNGEPNGHVWTAKEAKDATCTAKGNVAYFDCENCELFAVEVNGEKVITAWAEIETDFAEHTYGETWTCGNDGTHYKDCSVCGNADARISQNCADYGVSFGEKAPTCTESGFKAGTKCSVCDFVIKGTETDPALGHDFENGTVTETFAGNCQTESYVTTQCIRCDETKTVYGAKNMNVHTDLVKDNAVPATCTATGLTEGEHCEACGTVTKAQTETPALGHNFEGGKVVDTFAGNCQTESYVTTQCIRCDVTETVYGEKNPTVHTNLVKDDAVPATCTATGLTEGEHCAACNTVTVKQTETPALEHVFTYTSNGDKKTHTIGCERGDYTATGDCADADGNKFCDLCEQKLIDPKFTVDGVEVETLDEALALAVNGSTIKLLDNVVLTERLTLDKELRIDLEGYSITGAFEDAFGMIYVKKGAVITFVDGLIENTADVAIGNYGFVIVATDATVKGNGAGIYNFYFNGDYYGGSRISGEVNAIWNSGELVISEDGVVEYLDNSGYAVIYGTVAEIYAQDGSDAPDVSNGGLLIISDVANVGAVEIPEGFKLVEVEPYIYKVVAVEYKFQVGETKYETFAEAIAADGEIKLIADVTEETLVVAVGETIDLNGHTLTADIVGATIKMNGGNFATSDYLMVGKTAGKYTSSDAVFTIAANETMDMTVVSGTITLNDADWWTLADQTLVIAKDAKFVVPAGKNINVRGTVVVEGTAVTDGTVTLYNTGATVKAAADLNVISRTADYAVVYENGTYSLAEAAAKIGNKGYATFAEALATAQAGDTVTLLKDISATQIITIDKAITLDGNGKTLTSTAGRAINIETEGNVTIKNLTIEAKGERAINIINLPATVAIENVTATAKNYAIMMATSATAADLTVKNSNLTGLAVVNVASADSVVEIENTKITNLDATSAENYGAISIFKTAENTKVTVKGGEIVLGDDSVAASNGAEGANVTFEGTVGAEKVQTVVAYIGDAGYTSLQSAINDAKAGQTVTLIRDVTAKDIITVDKGITLDGNGKTLTSTAGRAINIETEGNVTIKNLTIEAKGERAINIINLPATVAIENVTATAKNYAIMMATSATAADLTVKNSNLTGLAVVNVASADSVVEIENTKITNLDATSAENYGAITVWTSAEGAKVTVTGGQIVVADDSRQAYVFPASATVEGVEDIGYIVALVGDAGFDTLEEALEEVAAGGTIEMVRPYAASQIITVDKAVTINGNGMTLTSTAARAINIDTTAVVTINDLTIVGGTGCERGINVINKAGTTNLNNLTVSGVSYYAVHVATSANAAKVNIADSNLTGWAAVAAYGNGTVVNVENSALVGINTYSGNTDAFATVSAGTNVTINVTGGSITAVSPAGKANQYIACTMEDVTGATFVLDTELNFAEADGIINTDVEANAIAVRETYAQQILLEGYMPESAGAGMVAPGEAAVAAVNGQGYTTLQDALDAAEELGEATVVLVNDMELKSHIMVYMGVTLDLNGHSLITTKTFTVYGDVIDGAEGGYGLVKASKAHIEGTKSYLSVYDTAAEGYRFFAYEVQNLGYKKVAGEDKVKFGLRISLSNAEGYRLLSDPANGNVGIFALVSWNGLGDGNTVTYSFKAETVAEAYAAQYANPNKTIAMTLTLNAVSKLGENAWITMVPAIATATGVVFAGDSCTWTSSN